MKKFLNAAAFSLVVLVAFVALESKANDIAELSEANFASKAFTSVSVFDFRSGLEARLQGEKRVCAIDTLRETLIQKHGSYIDRLGDSDKEACIQTLQAIEVLRCDKMYYLLGSQISVLDPIVLASTIGAEGFSADSLSQNLTSRMIQQVQTVRSETMDRIDSTLSGTRCSLLRGFTGYFAKQKLKSSVNQKLDDQVSTLNSTRLKFDTL